MAKVKAENPKNEYKVTTLGHIQRGGNPTATDRILGSRCGIAAVEGLMAGQRNCMAGVMNDQIVYTPFDDCISKSKPINQDYLKMMNILSI